MENNKNQMLFQFLDLNYMKQISRGDLAYERKVTRLFIEIIPENLRDLQCNFELRSYSNFNKILHHMQSSISIMGLDKKLAHAMNMDFNEEQDLTYIKENIDFISTICENGINEARQYLESLK